MNRINTIWTFFVAAVFMTLVHHSVWAAEVSAPIDIKRTVTFKGDFEKLKGDFLAKEPLLKLMPNVEQLKPMNGTDTWFTRMKPMGKMGVSHVAEYTSAYTYEIKGEQLVSTWSNVQGGGNADLSGQAVYTKAGDGQIVVQLSLKGSLNKIDVPALYVMGAPSVTRGIFEANVDQYLKNLSKNYGA